eukprot:569713-Hanusia_phi.AAC.1
MSEAVAMISEMSKRKVERLTDLSRGFSSALCNFDLANQHTNERITRRSHSLRMGASKSAEGVSSLLAWLKTSSSSCQHQEREEKSDVSERTFGVIPWMIEKFSRRATLGMRDNEIEEKKDERHQAL